MVSSEPFHKDIVQCPSTSIHTDGSTLRLEHTSKSYPGETISHSTRQANYASQVAGYGELSFPRNFAFQGWHKIEAALERNTIVGELKLRLADIELSIQEAALLLKRVFKTGTPMIYVVHRVKERFPIPIVLNYEIVPQLRPQATILAALADRMTKVV